MTPARPLHAALGALFLAALVLALGALGDTRGLAAARAAVPAAAAQPEGARVQAAERAPERRRVRRYPGWWRSEIPPVVEALVLLAVRR